MRSDDRRARVDEICEAALDRPPGERASFVAAACGDDSGLRREVDALLAHAHTAETFLTQPIAAVAADVFLDEGRDRLPAPVTAPLTGLRLGAYEILSLLGAGGMGEVYRARDTTLDRDVAIKILPRHFTSSPDRLARFEREARLLAALNHPHIGAIYGTIQVDDVRGLVLELIEGPTLADRRASGPMPLDEALSIARQIAEALEAAHDKGVVHRDLKPTNIKMTPGGTVKVIDFGLAKASGDGSDPTASPPISPSVTRSGVIIGSAAYMSPEQARGRPVDKRTDIWAFGCVLFEMLAGGNPFRADSASGSLAKVIECEPDWTTLPADVPAPIVRLLKRCLEKNPANRLHDIADARLEIADAISAPVPSEQPRHATSSLTFLSSLSSTAPWLVLAGIAIVTAGAIAAVRIYRPPASVDTGVQRLSILPPADATVSREYMALSPDGRMLAFVAASADGRSRLWIRKIDQLTAQPLAGTDAARYPFWSPDSRSIAFFAQHQLKKIQPDGGPAQVICDAPYGFGGAWSGDGVIVFAPDAATFLHRVAASGGVPTPVTTLDASQQQISHSSPTFLPDGRHFLYTVKHRAPRNNTIEVATLDGGAGQRVLDADSVALFAPAADGAATGYLVFVRNGTLLGQRFDVDQLEVTGDATSLADGTIPVMSVGAAAPFSVSRTGVLAYRSVAAESQLTWFDRSGTAMGTLGTPERYNGVELAPDGRHAAVERISPRDGTSNIWLVDPDTGLETQFTFDGASHPIWSPDGRFVTFNRNRAVFRKPVDGTAAEEQVYRESDGGVFGPVADWLPDGRAFVMRDVPEGTGSATGRLVLVTPGSATKPAAIAGTQFNGRVSPDGKWLAYSADENGVEEVYVQPFPATGAKWLVSRGGGVRPRWRRDGRELFFIASSAVNGAGHLMAVPVDAHPQFRVGTPRPLLDAPFVPGSANEYTYSVSPDGQRILVIEPTADAKRAPFTFVINWTAALQRR